jgi:hypothetical protein
MEVTKILRLHIKARIGATVNSNANSGITARVGQLLLGLLRPKMQSKSKTKILGKNDKSVIHPKSIEYTYMYLCIYDLCIYVESFIYV